MTRKEFPVRRGRNSPCDEKGVPPCDEEGIPPCDEEGIPEVSGYCEAEARSICQVDRDHSVILCKWHNKRVGTLMLVGLLNLTG